MKLPGKTLFIGGAVLALGIGGGMAVAQIPSADGTISACYVKSTGAIKIVDASVTGCKKGETSLTWTQTGAPGTPGTPGTPGQDGDDGADGVSGYEVVNDDFLVNSFVFTNRVAACPAGKKVIGGGVVLADPQEPNDTVGSTILKIHGSGPLFDESGWQSSFQLDTPSRTYSIRTTAICASV